MLPGIVALGFATSLNAQTAAPPPLPPLDLGQTNILDGEGRPGALLELIAFGSTADRLADAAGGAAPGTNRQRVASFIVHPIFVADATIAGAHPGIELLVPVSRVENQFAAGGSGVHIGFSDITVAPFLQWSRSDPGPGSVSARLALQIVAPVGDHAPVRPVNTGQGGWQLSPYLAVTWRASRRWEVSGRAIYDWSASATSRMNGCAQIRVQPGDLVAVNLSASYALSDASRLGIGGYGLQQLSLSRSARASLPESRQRIYGLGPVARWHVGNVTLAPAAFVEFGARNRPQGVSLNLRLQRPF
ncbi:transporter [uncultured Sphingomonas sp.]|uniref:SphA family protein n=1 Tax=uncultured Sphingomonas sp. TaxID=158754 RepID=UPI0035CC11FB